MDPVQPLRVAADDALFPLNLFVSPPHPPDFRAADRTARRARGEDTAPRMSMLFPLYPYPPSSSHLHTLCIQRPTPCVVAGTAKQLIRQLLNRRLSNDFDYIVSWPGPSPFANSGPHYCPPSQQSFSLLPAPSYLSVTSSSPTATSPRQPCVCQLAHKALPPSLPQHTNFLQ